MPDNLLIDALVDAAQRGVKVEIITPGKIDWNIVRRAGRSRWDKLMDAGVQFYEFQAGQYHCKVQTLTSVVTWDRHVVSSFRQWEEHTLYRNSRLIEIQRQTVEIREL